MKSVLFKNAQKTVIFLGVALLAVSLWGRISFAEEKPLAAIIVSDNHYQADTLFPILAVWLVRIIRFVR